MVFNMFIVNEENNKFDRREVHRISKKKSHETRKSARNNKGCNRFVCDIYLWFRF